MLNIKFCKANLLILLSSLMMLPKATPNVLDEEIFRVEREELFKSDLHRMIGNDIKLSEDEQKVNDILMAYKDKEMAESFATLNFLPAKHFFKARPEIEKSDVFKFIQKMPKGSLLHVHDMGMASLDWVIKELTYWDDLYMCKRDEDKLAFRYFDVPDNACAWASVAEERAKASSPEEFDNYLHSHLSLYREDPEEAYPDINAVWKSFENVFTTVSGIVMYQKAWESYLGRALQEFVNDNALYVEFRGVFPLLYEKDGSEMTEAETFAVYWNVIKNFTYNSTFMGHESHPVFFGAQYIYAPPRSYSTDDAWNYFNRMIRLRKQFPIIVAGFDIVGQEDIGVPLKDLTEHLLKLKSIQPPIPFFFHAGETNWEGMNPDENLFDALLLNATRIGHGYAITKHPKLIEMAMDKDIAIEVCPVSNQILKLVTDLRNHPAAALAADNFPIVVASDDPALWDATPLSHDFYEFFMGIGGARADLKMLKKLALNSIRHSTLDPDPKAQLEKIWRSQWKYFIMEILGSNSIETTDLTSENIL